MLLVLLSSLGILEGQDNPATAPIRVACVGDSLTAGRGIFNLTQNSYPEQLAALLGPKFKVRNFGVNGTSVLKQSNSSYWNASELGQAHAFDPDAVILFFGTDEFQMQSLDKLRSHFVNDYGELIQSFAALSSHPKIFLCLVPPAVSSEDAREMRMRILNLDTRTLDDECLPRLLEIAKDNAATVIDLHLAFQNKPELYSDTLHLNSDGAALIAAQVADAVNKALQESDQAVSTSK